MPIKNTPNHIVPASPKPMPKPNSVGSEASRGSSGKSGSGRKSGSK